MTSDRSGYTCQIDARAMKQELGIKKEKTRKNGAHNKRDGGACSAEEEVEMKQGQ